MLTPEEILALPMDPDDNDAKASTVRDYLIRLLLAVWEERDEFSGKRPFGNSSWEFDLYLPLIVADARFGTLDNDGYVDNPEYSLCDSAIGAAIRNLS